jgi:transposase
MIREGKTLSQRHQVLARRITDASWREFRRQLEYKSQEVRGRTSKVVVISRWYPSSKRCSNCGQVIAKLSLSERIFSCDRCHLTLDRDVNAARNIKEEGLAQLLRAASQPPLARKVPKSLTPRRAKLSTVSESKDAPASPDLNAVEAVLAEIPSESLNGVVKVLASVC